MIASSPKSYDIVHVINRIGIDIFKTLPLFYWFTGCDSNSTFSRKEKY